MDDDASMSVSIAIKQAREHPHDASEAVQTLFEYIEKDESEAENAAAALCLVAKHAPAAFDSQTGNFERALETTNVLYSRRNLVNAVTYLIECHAIPSRDAGRALTEATRVTTKQNWDERPRSGFLIIAKALQGWADVATMDEPVPAVIVKRAIEFTGSNDLGILTSIIDVLQAAVATDSPKTDLAFQGLVELTQVEDPTPTIKSEAILAVAELVLNDDIPDEAAAREVLTTNVDAVRRDKQLVEKAQEELPL